MASFEYQKLALPTEEIRLLELLPGRGTIRCRLSHSPLESASGHYEPLSYFWGLQTERVSIMVNDCEYSIGVNLHGALKRIRSLAGHESQSLWVDAICINQGDPKEKTIQVRLMAKIFGNGRRTLVWLGEHDFWTPRIWEMLTVLVGYASGNPSERINWMKWKKMRRQAQGKDEGSFQKLRLLLSADAQQAGHSTRMLQAFFQRPWFKRIWVLQEIATSRDALVICGGFQIDWEVIENAYEHFSHVHSLGGYLDALIAYRRSYQRSTVHNLDELLWGTNQFEATDSRDKIYAVLNLLNPGSVPDADGDVESHVEIDYSLSVDELFKRATASCLQQTGSTGILAAASGCRGPNLTSTSWSLAPVTRPTDVSGRWTFAWQPPEGKTSEGWCATGSSACSPELNLGDGLLGLAGYVVDTVESIGTVREYVPRTKHPYGCDENWRNLTTGPKNVRTYFEARAFLGVGVRDFYRDADITSEEALYRIVNPWWRSVLGNPEEDARQRKEWQAFDNFMMTKFGFMANSLDGPIRKRDRARMYALMISSMFEADLSNQTGIFEAAEFVENYSATVNRRGIKTGGQYCGIVGRQAQKGDKVVLLAGSRTPFILREHDGVFCLISDAYILGMMDGELWDESKCSTIWIN